MDGSRNGILLLVEFGVFWINSLYLNKFTTLDINKTVDTENCYHILLNLQNVAQPKESMVIKKQN